MITVLKKGHALARGAFDCGKKHVSKAAVAGGSLLMVGKAHAQAVAPDMDAKITAAGGTITSVQVIVASTVVFFTIVAIYKWVKKR